MLWNAATHGLSIPRDGGDKAAGTAKRRAQPSGTGFASRGAHGVLLPKRRVFLERRCLPRMIRARDATCWVFLERRGLPCACRRRGRRTKGFLGASGPLGRSVFWASAQPCSRRFCRALGGTRDGMAEQRRRSGDAAQGHRRTTAKPVCRTAKARGQSRGLESARAERSASLAMRRRLVAPRAVLLQLKTIRRIATVLLRDVVALLAVLAGEGDLGANILRLASHFLTPLVLSTKRGPLRDRSGGGA